MIFKFNMTLKHFKGVSVHLRFLTSGRTVEPATLFSHSSVPRALCVCAGAGGRLFGAKSTLAGGMEGRGVVDPSRF